MHIIIDGYGGRKDELESLDFITGWLDKYPGQIAMTKLMPPYVFRYEGEDPQDSGVSGFVLIQESHISVHTFPRQGHVVVDIFSMKSFDAGFAFGLVKGTFGLDPVQFRDVESGIEYPHDIEYQSLFRLLREEREGVESVIGTV